MCTRLWALICVLCLQKYCIKGDECHSPVGHGFSSCGKNTGSVFEPFSTVSVHSVSGCVRYCLASPLCEGVVVPMSDQSATLLCELYQDALNCGNVQHREGFQYYKEIERYHVCINPAPRVRSATRITNDTYTLFFDSMLQDYRLDEYGDLYAVSCLKDYFPNIRDWPSEHLKAVAQSDALGAGNRYFVVHGNSVEQYFFSSTTSAFPSSFAPWPHTIEGFFGAGVPETVNAVCAKDNEFYVYADDGIYTSTVLANNSQILTNKEPPFASTEFDWMSLTAAALTDDPEVNLLFQRNTYFLFNSVKREVIGRGTVCTNSY